MIRHSLAVLASVAALSMAVPAEAQPMRASWYQMGTKCADGSKFNPSGFSIALRKHPNHERYMISYHGRSHVAVHNDFGPHPRLKDRSIDLSRGLAQYLGTIQKGVVTVEVALLGKK